MKTGHIFSALALSIAMACVAGSMDAQESQDTGKFLAKASEWVALEWANPKTCAAMTVPTKTVYTRGGRERPAHEFRRGDAILSVTYFPTHNGAVEVSFKGGYPFEGPTAKLEIDGVTVELFTHERDEEYVWADPTEDQKIVTAMKQGANAVLTAHSKRGTRVQDTFSLIGATAMIEEAEKRCGS